MAILEDIGKKIRTLRTEKQMSRELFCGDEHELTVRQLGRIENGHSIPSLSKLEFIARTLDISLNYLIDEKTLVLPEKYLELKSKVIRSTTFGNKKRLEQKEQLLNEIYEEYYENLPEEEQLAIDILQSTVDVFASDNSKYGEGILGDYFEQLKVKMKYSLNDLLLISLYFNMTGVSLDLYDETFERISERIVEQEEYQDLSYITLIQRNILNIIAIKEHFKEYQDFPKYIVVLKTIMETVGDFNFKPIVTMIEARYYTDFIKDRDKGLELYDKALQGAEFLNNEDLKQRISEDKMLFFK